MTARAVPVMPNFFAGQKLTGSLLNQVTASSNFWTNPPYFSMYQSISQSIPNNTLTTITMDTPEWDTDSGRAATTPFGYTIPAGMTGRWAFRWGASWNANITGSRKVELFKNGAVVRSAVFNTTNNADIYAMTGSRTLAVNAGDVMTVVALQNCGGGLGTQVGTEYAPFFEGELVSLANP